MRTHLDFNKWEESAYNESLLKSRRHLLHAVPKNTTGEWKDMLSEAWFK